MPGSKPRLLLLSRPGCHLCEEFRDELRAGFDVELVEACVDDRAEWRRDFGARIPVLLDAAGRVICEATFDAEALKAVL